MRMVGRSSANRSHRSRAGGLSMPGPFPGMDPYIEDAELWRDAHHWFISAAAEQLQPQLNPRGYYVGIESRVWMEEPERAVYPDIILRHAPEKARSEGA